jgi:hypothetical protein
MKVKINLFSKKSISFCFFFTGKRIYA